MDPEKLRKALKSVKKATKVASTALIYHQAYLEKSAESNNWDLKPFAQKIMQNYSDDISDTDDDYPANMKVSKEKYKKLMEGN